MKKRIWEVFCRRWVMKTLLLYNNTGDEDHMKAAECFDFLKYYFCGKEKNND